MDKSALQRRDYRLRAVAHVEAHENDADVAFNRGFSDAEVCRNLLIALASDKEIENFALACAEVGIGDARIEGARDRLG